MPHIHTITAACINAICFVKVKDYDTTISVSFMLSQPHLLTVAIIALVIDHPEGFVNFTTATQI